MKWNENQCVTWHFVMWKLSLAISISCFDFSASNGQLSSKYFTTLERKHFLRPHHLFEVRRHLRMLPCLQLIKKIRNCKISCIVISLDLRFTLGMQFLIFSLVTKMATFTSDWVIGAVYSKKIQKVLSSLVNDSSLGSNKKLLTELSYFEKFIPFDYRKR